MKRAFFMAGFLILALPAFAIDTTCDSNLVQLGALYEIRSLMMRTTSSSYEVQHLVDRQLDELRGPLPNGGYRWVRWVRPGGEGPYDKKVHEVTAVHDRGDADSFEGSADHVYAVRVAVPRKRSLFKGNNPVYVGTVRVSYTVDGRRRTKELPVNQWMNPDTSRTLDLDAIADRAEANVDVGVKQSDIKEAVAELHFRQAVAEDDPANPDYEAIRTLQRVRQDPDAERVDSEIASTERKLFPQSDPLPILGILHDLRSADEMMRSTKPEEQEKGSKLLKETLRKLR